MQSLSDFYNKKRIFITGHTGFKGSWMCQMLVKYGAEVFGYALEPQTEPSLFHLIGLEKKINSINGDIRDLKYLQKVIDEIQPEVVIHMAAQPIVRDSYKNPVYTYEVNVMGTVNIMECIRTCSSVKSFINVTTDKVYLNREWIWGYREGEELNGFDPYSNSKSCSELVTSSYKKSFFSNRNIAISTVRAGNVIGGGDFAKDRIIPDCIRAAIEKKDIIVRNPDSIRPYQYVLEPIYAYLLIAQRQWENKEIEGNYNVGPDDIDCWSTEKLVNLFCKTWNQRMNTKVIWKNISDHGPHEATYLKLDCTKLKSVFGWKPHWNLEITMDKIIKWTQTFLENGDLSDCMNTQINEFLGENKSGV